MSEDELNDAIACAAIAVKRRAQTLRDAPHETWGQDVASYEEDIRDALAPVIAQLSKKKAA